VVPQPFGRDGQAESFPAKLYRLLAEAERSGHTHIISFTPNGRSFLIHDPETFMSDIAPTFFSQTQFKSFRRQLSFYGFDRISKEEDRGAFTHTSFLRGRPELLGGVQRQIVVVVPRAKKT
jgi:heat shock transcription factor